MNLDKRISEAIEKRKLLIKSYLLREEGEEKLERILHKVMAACGRTDLIGPAYACMRELVQNAAKANLKRVVFEEQGLNPHDEEQYLSGLDAFRKSLASRRIQHYRPILHERDVPFFVRIKWDQRVLLLQVDNHYSMLPVEESRIREKFMHSRGMDNLYEFFMTYGDSTEGAGMGIAMVQILLRQANMDIHNFTIFSDGARNRTTARIIMPLSADYRTPRARFDEKCQETGLSAQEMRSEIAAGKADFPIFT